MHKLKAADTLDTILRGDDVVIAPHQLRRWQLYFSEESAARLWVCPGGRYFFHYFYAQQTADEILRFWRSLASHSVASSTV